MTIRHLGPHVINPSAPALLWSARAPIVKAVGNTAALVAAPSSAIRVYRHVWTPAEQDEILDAQDADRVVFAILDGLDGYRHPNLYVETLNEVGKGRRDQYITHLRLAVVPRLHAAGLKVAGPSWATGDFEYEDWEAFCDADWCGLDAIALHAYWSTAGLTPWNALRYRTYWDRALDPDLLLVTECGRDRVRDGNQAIDEGYLPAKDGDDFGYRAEAQHCTDDQFVAELEAFDAELAKDGVYGVVFTLGPTDDWTKKGFDVDPLAERLAVLSGPTTAPKEDPMPDQPTLCTMAMWRQGNDLRPEQQTFDGLANALTAGGFTVAVADVLQGTTPQATFSKTSIDIWAPRSAAGLATFLKGRGIRFWPMQNVLGEDIPAEVAALKTYADAVHEATGESTVVLDFEAMYPQFFEPSGDLAAAIGELVAEVDRVFTPGRWTVILCPDPRQIGREYALDLFPKHWVLMLQTYNKDFGMSWQECYRRYLPWDWTVTLDTDAPRTNAAASHYGGRTVIPMLQGDLSTLEMRDIWTWLAQHSRWACVWGFGALAPETTAGALDDFEVARAVAGPYEALPMAVPVVPVPEPEPTPVPTPVFDIAAARQRLWDEADALDAAGYPWFANGVKSAVAQSKGDR